MPLDPELVAETSEWLLRAAADLRAGEVLITATPPLTGTAVFHSQQAAEKSFKGFLAWHSTPFRKTHNLEEVGDQCLRIDATLKPLVDRVVPLTKYAWKFRYPGEPADPDAVEAEAALTLAREVYEAILARLPVEVRPRLKK